MTIERFANLPAPPYYAVIFSSQRPADSDNDGYGPMAEYLDAKVRQQPGFLGVESTRDTEGFGITVAYFDSEEAIAAWRRDAEHATARERGRKAWYEHFELRIAKVERAYGKARQHGTDE